MDTENNVINSFLQRRFFILAVISLMLLFISVFICRSDETVTAEGQIRPQVSETSITAQFSGIVTEIFYRNTQFVNENDTLFIQDCNYEKEYLENQKNLEKLYGNYITAYKQLQKLLTSATTEICNFKPEIIRSNAVYSTFVNQYKNYQNELTAKEKYYIRQSKLYPSVISKQELENIENNYLQAKFAFSGWIEKQKIEILENLSDYSQKLEECELKIYSTNREIENATVKANKSGYINEKTIIRSGDYLNKGTEILTIIPATQNLKAVININNSNISKIKLGQEVLLQIRDLPYTKFGKLKGKISLIPSDATVSDTVYFPVEVDLEKNFLQSKSRFSKIEKVNLKIGTKVTAKVIVDKNTIFQKLVQKLVIYDN